MGYVLIVLQTFSPALDIFYFTFQLLASCLKTDGVIPSWKLTLGSGCVQRGSVSLKWLEVEQRSHKIVACFLNLLVLFPTNMSFLPPYLRPRHKFQISDQTFATHAYTLIHDPTYTM